KRMAAAGEDPCALSAILITHEHQDHVAGLATLARRLRIPVYFTEPTHRAWVRMVTPRSTMTYAEWLAHVQREKELRAAQTAAAEAGSPADSSAAVIPSEGASPITIAAMAESDPEEKDEDAKPDPSYLPAVEYFCSGAPFTIGDIAVTPFTIPHDAA